MAGPSLGRLLLAGIAATVGLALGWQVVTWGVSTHLQETAPEAAVRWRGDNSQALAALAQGALARNAPDEARRYARLALSHAPIETTAFRVLGQTAAVTGDAAEGARLMAHAGALTRRDTATSYWLFREALLAGRYSAAFERADELMRRAPKLVPITVWDLVPFIADPRALPPMVQRLAQSPPWRSAFLEELNQNAPSDVAATSLLFQLAETDRPPTSAELSPFLARMTGAGEYEVAYQFWRALLPPGERAQPRGIYDEGFTKPAGPAPFGWDVARDAQDAEAFLEGKAGLQVRVNGFVEADVARQLILLPAGEYRLSSRARLVEGQQGALEWRMRCAKGGVPDLLRVRLDVHGVSQAEAEKAFTVPPGCAAQRLALRAVGGDRHEPAVILVENVRTERLEAKP